MRDVNKVVLMGRLGKDPELRRTASGKSVANLSVATNRPIRVDDGWQDKTEWHRVVVWEKQAERLAANCHKGDAIAIVGDLRYGEYVDKQGLRRFTTDVVASDVTYFSPRRNDDVAPRATVPATSRVEAEPPF